VCTETAGIKVFTVSVSIYAPNGLRCESTVLSEEFI
jgi:hypothetical protein